jgi:hypothetical protein
MTLGQYITILTAATKKICPKTILTQGLGNPHSWRGDYYELAFEPVKNISLGDMLKQANEAVGATYPGYKGGEFTMDKSTPIHIDNHGNWSNGEQMTELLLSFLPIPIENYKEWTDGDQMWSLLLAFMLNTKTTKTTTTALAEPPMYSFSKDPEKAAIELIDGAYDLIEIFKPQSPAQNQWRLAWLKKAKELGAQPSW